MSVNKYESTGPSKGRVTTDLSTINTNDGFERVQRAMANFDRFVRNGPYFGVQQAGRFLHTTDIILGDEEDKPVVSGDKGKNTRMKFVATITVNKDMCNKFGIMNGACAAYLLDTITTATLVCLGDPPRVSLALDISFFQPASLGTKLKLVGYTTAPGRSIAHTRGEIWDADKSVLLMSCTHIQANPKNTPSQLTKEKAPTTGAAKL